MIFKKNAFTLIEVLVSVTIISAILIVWFQTYTFIFAWKIRLIENTDLQKQAIFFTERLFQSIKKGWTIDYEEYFNRKIVWTSTQSWHYDTETWFGNFWKGWTPASASYWDEYYYCRSSDWTKMTSTWWCFYSYEFMSDLSWASIIPFTDNNPQRYWQYSFQFLDYNTDANGDLWDLDWDTNIIWDDDDENLWNWPRVFTGWVDVRELYLISWDKKTRTYFRHNVIEDPNAPISLSCDIAAWTGSWCLGNIQFLKLIWKDWWMDHVSWSSDSTENDWVIDTWLVAPWFWPNEVAWSNSTEAYWKNLFPSSINVSKFEVFPVPNLEESRAWNITNVEASEIKVSPYVILNIELKPSYEIQKKIRWKIRSYSFNTTINLTEIFSK